MTEEQKSMLLLQIDLMKSLNEDLTPEKRLFLLDKLAETIEGFVPARIIRTRERRFEAAQAVQQ